MASGQLMACMAGERDILQRAFLRDAKVAHRLGRKACDEPRQVCAVASTKAKGSDSGCFTAC